MTLSAIRNDVDVYYAAYGGGYVIYVLNVDADFDFNAKRRGDCRLEIIFGTALAESVTVLMYGKFPRIKPAVSRKMPKSEMVYFCKMIVIYVIIVVMT